MAGRSKRAQGEALDTRPKRGAGRPSQYTPEIHARVVQFVRSGCYLETAAAAAGIHRHVLHDWLRYGAAGRTPYAAFLADIEEAQAKAEIHDLALIAAAAKTDWRAAAWRLEKRFQDRYGGKRPRDDAEAQQPATVVNVHYPANGRDGGEEP